MNRNPRGCVKLYYRAALDVALLGDRRDTLAKYQRMEYEHCRMIARYVMSIRFPRTYPRQVARLDGLAVRSLPQLQQAA